MADSRDRLSLSLDDILAAAHKLAADESATSAHEATAPTETAEAQSSAGQTSQETAPAAAPEPTTSKQFSTQSVELPAQDNAPARQSSGFNFVFEPAAIERLESIFGGTSQPEPQPQPQSQTATPTAAPAMPEQPSESPQASAPAPAAREKSRPAPSMVMTGIVSDYAQPSQPQANQAQPAPQQRSVQQQSASQQQEQQQPVQQPAQQSAQQSSQQQPAPQPTQQQQPAQQPTQQPQPASQQQQPAPQPRDQQPAPAQHQPQATQPEPEAPGDLDANIDVISALPAIPRAFTSAPPVDPIPAPAFTAAHVATPESQSEPSRSRQEQRAAQRAAEIAAGQREPSRSYASTTGGARHSARASSLDDATPPRSSARQRRSNSELASQAEVRSWEQAGVQRAALEFLKNSRREYAKTREPEEASQPYPADSGFTQPIKLNPVEATSAVSEARKAEVEQKVFVNSQPVASHQPQDVREHTAVPSGAPTNTPATPIDVPLDAQPAMPMSAPIDPDNNDMSWVDASRPEWTDLPTKKTHRSKKKHEYEEEPVREKKKHQRKSKEKATKLDKIAEDEQFRSALTNGTSFSEAALDAGVASSIDDRMRQARKQQSKRIKRRVIAAVIVCVLGAGIGVGVGMGYFPITVENGQVIFGDKKLVLGDKQPSTSSGSTSSSSGNTPSGSTGGSKKAEKEKDQTGTVIYGYTLTDPNGEPYTVTETVEFGSEGLCGNSTTEATFTNTDAAADYLATVQRDYGKSFVSGSNEGMKTTVTVDVTSSKLDRERYEDALRNTVADLMIIKKS